MMYNDANARVLRLRRSHASCQYDNDGREISCSCRAAVTGSKALAEMLTSLIGGASPIGYSSRTRGSTKPYTMSTRMTMNTRNAP